MVVVYCKLHVLPIAVFMWFIIAFLVSTIIAVLKNHCPVFLCYVSDGGSYPPEMGIFGIMLNIGSILLALLVYIRYRQVDYYYRTYNLANKIRRINIGSLYVGLISSSGISMVGSFQKTTLGIVHLVATLTSCGFGIVYIIIQTKVSVSIYPYFGAKWLNNTRIVITFLTCFTALMYGVFWVAVLITCNLHKGSQNGKWNPKSRAYIQHIISAISEWISLILALAFCLTFAYDFKSIVMFEPRIAVVSVNNQTRDELV